MKSKLYREGRPRSLIAALVLLLTVAAVGTTPWALAKYAATGTGSATARVAKFDPVWEYQASASDILNSGAGIVIHPGNLTQEYKVVWRLHNNGETLVKGLMIPYINTEPETGVHAPYPVGYYRSALNGGAPRIKLYYDKLNPAITSGQNDWWTLLMLIDSAEKQVPIGDYVDFTATIIGYDTLTYTNETQWASVNALTNGGTIPGAYEVVNVTGEHAGSIYFGWEDGGPTVNSPIYHVSPWKTYRVNFDGIVTQVD